MDLNYFIFWGCFGMFAEITFTAFRSLVCKKEFNLIGHCSLWMFPIYALGLTYGFDVIKYLISNDMLRWLTYPLWIWGVEILIGLPSSNRKIKIWDYSYLPDKFHWRGIISFIHYPIWLLFGITVEFLRESTI